MEYPISLILQDWIWVVHVPFVRMVKLVFFCTVPSGSPCRPNRGWFYPLSVLIAAFAYYVIDRFVSIAITYICFVTSYLSLFWYGCAGIRRDSVFLLRFPFLSHVPVFSCEISLVNRLKRPYSCFFSHFCFLVISVLLILVPSELYLIAVICIPPRFSM